MLQDPDIWGAPATASHTETTGYADAAAQSWNHLHPRLARRGTWADHQGELPVIPGTLIRLDVQHLPGYAQPKPLWLWTSAPDLYTAQAERSRQSYLRRFDLEHTFGFLKQNLGWNPPHMTSSWAGDTWTWLVVAAHPQLPLARELTGDLRRPWKKSVEPHKLSPAWTRRVPVPPPEAAAACQRTETHASGARAAAGPRESMTGHHSSAGETDVKG